MEEAAAASRPPPLPPRNPPVHPTLATAAIALQQQHDDPSTPRTPRDASSPQPSSSGAFFALDTPLDSPPSAVPVRFPPPKDSASTEQRRWTSLRRFFQLNVVQRCLSAAVLVPLVTFFLWRSPAFATATFCAFVTSLCSYEYAWLAHRIHVRIVTKVSMYEQESLAHTRVSVSSTAGPQHENCDAPDTRDNSSSRHRRDRSNRSTRSESMTDDADTSNANNINNDGVDDREGSDVDAPSQSRHSSSFHFESPRAHSQQQQRHPSTSSPIVTPEMNTNPSSMNGNVIDGEIYLQDVDATECAVSGIALKYFGGKQWLAAMVLSLFTSLVMSTAFLLCAPWIPELETTELYRLRWFYAITTDYVASLSAFFTPNWKYAFICLVEKVVFTLLTLHSTICPINQFGCGLSMEPAQVFLTGVVLILLFRLNTRRTSGLGVFLHIVLDVLGFLYIVGSLSVIVAFVDDEQLESYRKLLIVLLYVVWASDTGAYLTGKLLEHLNYKYYNPLAAHLSKNKDYEGTLGAIAFGIAAMHFASDLLDVRGSMVAKVTFTVLAVVAGRVGDLFESLLKRAAGVKDSGKLIPGHGGVLDRIDALMFASLVFARYYAMIVVPNMQSEE